MILKEKLDEVGVENDITYPEDGRGPAKGILAMGQFLKKHLQGK
jgi:hypothetical protein